MRFLDSLVNLVAGLGVTGKDKAAADGFALTPLTEPQIDAMVDGDWVARKIVSLPVADIFRVWREWAADAPAVTAFEEAEKRHKVRKKLSKAMRLARRYGGAVVIIGADTADPTKPLNLNAVKAGGLKYLTVLPRRAVTPGPPDLDPESPFHGEPAHYTLNTEVGRQIVIHPSRVIRFVGAERDDALAALDGWGYSSLQAPYEAVHHAALAPAAAASMLHEAKTDIINVSGLSSLLSSDEGTRQLQKRFTLANTMKSINNTLLLDENEKHNRVATSFTGVPDLLARFLAVAAAAADIPAARFLAQSASGLNASGDADVRNYYDHLASVRAETLDPALEMLDAVLWRDATGKPAPKGAVYEWEPLWQPTEQERVATFKTLTEAVSSLATSALIDEVALSVGVQNALIESGVLPGLEQALASATVAVDPANQADPASSPAASPDNPPTRDAYASGREWLTAAAKWARARDHGGSSIVRH